MSIASRPMTTEELLALPDDDVDRELIRGELRESPATTQCRPHCIALANLGFLLGSWMRSRPRPWGETSLWGVPIRLRRDPDTFVGADLVYLSPEQAARIPPDATFIDEPPVLVVEVLSPSDQIEAIAEKRSEYLNAGVALVWIVNPYDRTVTVYRPGSRPVLFNTDQELTAEPDLPGFRAAVAEIFQT